MNPNKATHRISISENTLLSDLRKFADNLDDNAKLRGKINKDGTYSLKISTKGRGTGVKDILFDTVKIRRNSARVAISRVAIREGNLDLAKAMRKGMNSSKEFTAGDLKNLLSTAASQQRVEFNLTPEQSLDQAFKICEFKVTRNEERHQPITISHFFKATKDIIYGLATKSHDTIAQELKRDGLIKNDNLGTMDAEDRRILNSFIATENERAAQKEANLPNTEHNKFAKLWKKIQFGINLIPPKRTPERDHFEKMSYEFSREMEGHELFPVNVGELVLGHGVDIDRGLNMVLAALGSVANQISSGDFDMEETRTLIKNLAGDPKLDLRLKKLEFAAKLLTNDRYLQTFPKEKRLALGILGVNMANLAEIFKKPNGQYQSLCFLLESLTKNPDGFIEWVRRELGQLSQLPEQPSKPLMEDEVNMSESQEQIEFSDLGERPSTQL